MRTHLTWLISRFFAFGTATVVVEDVRGSCSLLSRERWLRMIVNPRRSCMLRCREGWLGNTLGPWPNTRVIRQMMGQSCCWTYGGWSHALCGKFAFCASFIFCHQKSWMGSPMILSRSLLVVLQHCCLLTFACLLDTLVQEGRPHGVLNAKVYSRSLPIPGSLGSNFA